MSKKKEKVFIQIIQHFPITDQDFIGDYYDIELKMNGVVAATFGDYYHDKGEDKVKGFLSCVEYLFVKKSYEVHEVRVADRDPC